MHLIVTTPKQVEEPKYMVFGTQQNVMGLTL